jgi:hypothetical protein
MKIDMEARLAELQDEFRTGEARLRELDLETARLRETLLRISGAIQVLQELLAAEPADSGAVNGADPVAAAGTVP